MNNYVLTPEQRLKRIEDYIARMPSLSTTVTKVLEVCNNPQTSPHDLNRVISLDPVLTGKVLRLINSAYYSLRDQVTSLTRAIIMLGLNNVKNLALSTAVLSSLGGNESSQAFSMDDFWTHSICVGVIAKTLAIAKGVTRGDQEEYFMAGLMHDLGKIPLISLFPEEYTHTSKMAREEGIPFIRAENLTLGINHCAVWRMIADKWQLSESFSDSLYCHHNPDKANENNLQLAAIVALSNAYSNSLEIGSSGETHSDDKTLNYFFKRAGINRNKLNGLEESTLKEIEKARVFLQVAQNE